MGNRSRGLWTADCRLPKKIAKKHKTRDKFLHECPPMSYKALKWSCGKSRSMTRLQGVSKVRSDFFFASFHWLLKIPFVKLSMLLIIHLTLNSSKISNHNAFLYVIWHFISGRGIELKTLQSRRLAGTDQTTWLCDISTGQYQSSSGLLRYHEFTEIYMK